MSSVYTSLLPDSFAETNIFQVGFEEASVFRILARAVHPVAPLVFGISAFAHATVPGYVFLEADCLRTAKAMVEGIRNVYHNRIRAVHPYQWKQSLRPERLVFRPQKDGWVRLRGCRRFGKQYTGDIAFIRNVSNAGVLDLLVIPRWYEELPKSRHPKDWRPTVRRLGSPTSTGHPYKSQKANTAYTDNGFLLWEAVDLESYIPAAAIPSLADLHEFSTSGYISETAYHKVLVLLAEKNIKIQDRVSIMQGEFLGLSGVVMSTTGVSGDGVHVDVHIPSQDIVAVLPTAGLRREFWVADHVEVIVGEHSGATGWVVNVLGHVLTISTSKGLLQEVSFLRVCHMLLGGGLSTCRIAEGPKSVRSVLRPTQHEDWTATGQS